MTQCNSVFPSASDARHNPRSEMVIHEEICGIQTAILNAINLGLFETTVSDGTPMTDSYTPMTDVWTVNTSTDDFYIPNHNLKTGDAVTVTSTVTLPAPLVSTAYYYVIYVDPDHIKLAPTYADSVSGRPIHIDITSGVVQVTITNAGTGYLQAPVVNVSGGNPTAPASLRSYLSTWGNIVDVSNTTSGSGYGVQPSVSIVSLGSGATVGTITYQTVSVVIQNAGTNYHLGDIISIVGGTGTPTTARISEVDGSGSILSLTLINPGSYTVLPPVTNAPTTVIPGGGAGATVNITMGIKALSLSSGGTGYVSPPRVTINSMTGTGAVATANIYGGQVSEIIILNSGYGYLDVSSVQLDTGSGATGIAMLLPTSVSSAVITNNGGNTYTAAPPVTISTQGSGASSGTVSVKVVAAQLTSGGANYRVGDTLLISGGIATENAWIRVATVDNNGCILSYVLEEGGSYTSLPGLVANPVNGGNGTLAGFNLLMGLESIVVTSGGSGYIVPPIVTVSDPANGGTTAQVMAVITSGSITKFLINSAGFNYTAIPTVTISNGSGATGTSYLTPTTLGSITVTSGGVGYTSATVTITGGGASSNATATAVINSGSIVSINITYSGTGYTSSPSITISGDGTGATASPTLTPTSVAGISIDNPGSGYNTQPIISMPGAATAISILNGTGIQKVVITSQGQNYVADPTVYLIPGPYQGTTPQSPVLIAQRAFSVGSIGIISAGDGYQSNPTLTMVPPFYSTGITATATATIGSGLGTFTLMRYLSSKDYYKAWKGQQLSNNLLSRPYIDRMDTVISYFTNLGYNITRLTNPATNSTLMWKIVW